MSHLGRPKGRRVAENSLKPCATVLGRLLGQDVGFIDDCIGEKVDAAVSRLDAGEVLLLENLRYYEEETANDFAFAAKLGALGDVYVNDAFGTAHRAHASTVGITGHIDQCAAGFLLMKELDYFSKVMENPPKPFVAVLGGAKISGKIDVVLNLLPKVDKLIIGGGMAYTFFKAMGREIGGSILEEDKVELAKEILEQGKDKILLPVDCMVADRFDFRNREVGQLDCVASDAIPAGCFGLDIGHDSIAQFQTVLQDAKLIVWNGPMGVFEIEETAKGTCAIAVGMAEAGAKGAVTVIGGGDSAAAVNLACVEEKICHISTGGGASLELLEGKILPGLAALSDR
jgi:phosphoglycerate kinase